MLYHLLYPLHEIFGPLNVFRYVTFRTAGAVVTALVLCWGLGPWMIAKLTALQLGQHIREEGPESHHAKAGTPTMGGVLIISSVLLATLLWADLKNVYVWLALGTTLLFAGIGFIDDWLKARRKENLGLRSIQKFGLQVLVSLGAGVVLIYLSAAGSYSTRLHLPFFKSFTPDLGWGYLVLGLLVLVGTSNAVNLTDGLDGLAVGSMLITAATYTLLTYIAGHALVADYLNVANIKGSAEVSIFCGALVGACLGFLWYNSHPAEIFMGDTGSLSLGAAIGITALIIKQELLLILVGGLYVIEAMSVIIQVGSYRLRGKRVFRMAPLHHHFEYAGWAESKIVIRFWILAILFSLMSLSTLKLR